MKVTNNLLFEDNGSQVPFKQTPNHGGKKKDIRFIVIHYDGSPNATGAISWMLSPTSKVSAELHLTRDAKTTQLLPFDLTAYHAGKSEWKGVVGLNSHSIGIELQNSGNQEYPKEQLNKLVEICKALVMAYPIEEIVGHSDISPGRKIDPGKQFPMEWFRQMVFNGEPKVNILTSKFTTSDLNIRETGKATGKLVSVLPKGTEVNVLQESEGWSNVFVCKSKLIGWVSSKYLK